MGNIIDSIRDQEGTVYDIHSTDIKYITLELLPQESYNSLWYRGALRLHLIGFNENDVGTHIWLLRKSFNHHGEYFHKNKRVKKGSYKHPANYDSGRKDICKMGYGVLVGKKSSYENSQDQKCVYGDVPSWMPHNGYLQTEWEITSEHIEQGYMDIDIGREFLSLLVPIAKFEDDHAVDPISFDLSDSADQQVHIIGGRAQLITYAQVKEDKIICFSRDNIYVGTPDYRLHNYDYPGLIYATRQIDEEGNRAITQNIAVRIM